MPYSLRVPLMLLLLRTLVVAAPFATARRSAEPILLDGRLNDAVWSDAAPIGSFTQREPLQESEPSEQTIVRVAYTPDFLYIAVRCLDSTPHAILATQMTRDADISEDDRIEILLDTFHDGRNAYYFATNPSGALVDGRITESSAPNTNWDGIWNVRTAVDAEGWSAEFSIPFKTLGFGGQPDDWGFNVSRTLARLREESRWTAASFDAKFYQVALAGTLTGLEGLSQGIGLDVKPYGLAGYDHDAVFPDRSSPTADAGVDIFWRLTPNLVSSTTFNTDFAETEVDRRQVNLTRFPLFFAEKRAFFLEDEGIFEFAGAGRGREFLPFFSRRIGLVAGQEVPILAGTKLTGKAGRFDVGLINVQTRDSEVAPGQNLAVGRVKANFLKQSYLGAIFTNGDPTGASRNSVGGVDLKLFTSDFLGKGKNAGVALFGSKSRTADRQGRNSAYGMELAYPNDFVDLTYRWTVVGENYDPALGFVARPRVRLQDLRTNLRPRPDFWGIRQMNYQFNYTEYYNLAHHSVESRQVFTAPINWRYHNGEHLEYNWVPTFERLFQPFEIRPGIKIPAGSYWFHRNRLEFNSAENRRWLFDTTYWFGSFYTGSSHELRTAVRWRKNRHLTAFFELEQFFVDLREGDFTTRLAVARADYAFSPFVSLSNLVQYDTETSNVGLQSRLRWIWRPGNELFLVWNHEWQEDPLGRFSSIHSRVRAKLNYTVRF